MKQWRAKNKDRIKKYNKKYKKKYYIENKEKYIEYAKQFKEKNPEYRMKRYIKNKERELECHKIYYTKNKQKLLDKRRKLYYEREKKYHRLYIKTDKGKITLQRNKAKRRAKERNIINTLTLQEWEDVLIEFNHKCAYCNSKTGLVKEHIIPISKGGNNVRENVVPSCGICNSKKGNKVLIGGIYAF